jgi:hypothetical protein
MFARHLLVQSHLLIDYKEMNQDKLSGLQRKLCTSPIKFWLYAFTIGHISCNQVLYSYWRVTKILERKNNRCLICNKVQHSLIQIGKRTTTKECRISQAPLAHAFNCSYLGGWNWEDHSSRPAQTSSLQDPISTITRETLTRGALQV